MKFNNKIPLYLFVLVGLLILNQACKSTSRVSEKKTTVVESTTQSLTKPQGKKEESYEDIADFIINTKGLNQTISANSAKITKVPLNILIRPAAQP